MHAAPAAAWGGRGAYCVSGDWEWIADGNEVRREDIVYFGVLVCKHMYAYVCMCPLSTHVERGRYDL